MTILQALSARVKRMFVRGTPLTQPIQFLPAPVTPEEVKRMTEENDATVKRIISLDERIRGLGYLPKKNRNDLDPKLHNERAVLIARHLLMVMALNGNPHKKARTQEERNRIVRDTMRKA